LYKFAYKRNQDLGPLLGISPYTYIEVINLLAIEYA